MRATNLGFKNPHQIYHADFQVPTVDCYGKKIEVRGKTGGIRRPRARTADRFNNQYSKNYNTNCLLSPSKYNPLNGTIAGELKHKRTIRYVEDTIGSRSSNYYTYVDNMKIFNPEVISPKHQRLLTPMHSKSKTIDLKARLLNTVMATLEKKMNYEKEAVKATAAVPLQFRPVSETSLEELCNRHGNGNETPSTRFPGSSRFDSPAIPSLTFNSNLTPSYNLNPSQTPTSNAYYSNREVKQNNRANNHSSSHIRLQSNYTSLEADSLCTTFKIPKDKSLVHGQSNKSTVLETGAFDGKSGYDSTKSIIQFKKDRLRKVKEGLDNRFISPKDNVCVVAVNLKEFTRKLIKTKGKL